MDWKPQWIYPYLWLYADVPYHGSHETKEIHVKPHILFGLAVNAQWFHSPVQWLKLFKWLFDTVTWGDDSHWQVVNQWVCVFLYIYIYIPIWIIHILIDMAYIYIHTNIPIYWLPYIHGISYFASFSIQFHSQPIVGWRQGAGTAFLSGNQSIDTAVIQTA